MRICREYHIPHGHFAGGPRWWSQTDRDKALAYELLLREQCPKCSTLEEDWIDPRTRRPLMDPVWAAVPKQCHGCADVERMQKAVESQKMAGVHVVFVPFDDLDDYELEPGEQQPPVPVDLNELRP